jgi:shikimate dehydrogenase
MMLSTTGLVAILGTPIAQVQSPANFNRWFQEQGLDLAMLPLDLQPDALQAFIAAMRGWNNLHGCVVTVPYKQAVVPLLDELSPRARLLRSVNVIRRSAQGRLLGDNVDGEGFIKAAAAHGFTPAGKRALVLGAGGVGAAIAYSLTSAGLAELDIVDPTPGRTAELAATLTRSAPAVAIREQVRDLSGYDLVVNASAVGMGDTGDTPLPIEQLAGLSPRAHVADVVTKPADTSLLKLARARGCTVQAGPEMALAQMQALGAFMGVMPG